MRPPGAFIDFLKAWEGLPGGRPALTAYDDGGGVWTIGYGHTEGVKPGDSIDADKAGALLLSDLDERWCALDEHIHVTLAEHEMCALTSLAFNIGVPAVAGSTLLRRLNGNRFDDAAAEFRRWNRAGGRIVPGLTKRREAERRMFVDAFYGGRP